MVRIRLVGVGILILVATAAGFACGGRTQLVPAYQIGRLSDDAVVASEAGVRVVIRTAAWPGPPIGSGVIPVEVTFDNSGLRSLDVRRQHLALVTSDGRRAMPLDPAAITQSAAPLEAIQHRALLEGALPSPGRIVGFLYFAEPDADTIDLRVDLISSPDRKQFGEIVIPFAFD